MLVWSLRRGLESATGGSKRAAVAYEIARNSSASDQRLPVISVLSLSVMEAQP